MQIHFNKQIENIVFEGITWLDFIGVYDPISRLKSLNYIPDLSWDICSYTDEVSDNFGLKMQPTKICETLENYDAIIIPGGFGTRSLQFNNEFIEWIKTSKDVKHKISICTRSLILGAAGFLKDRKATTNYQEYETLKSYCKEVIKDRIAEDNDIISSGAVSVSIDLGLYLCNKWAGEEAKNKIKKQMDYNCNQ